MERKDQGVVVGDQHFTHFLPLQTATYLSEAKEDGSQHPAHDTCGWTVAGPTSPLLEKRRELAVQTLNRNETENKKVENGTREDRTSDSETMNRRANLGSA